MSIRVYRVQDHDGRGPFRPGFSVRWLDQEMSPERAALPSWVEEFGDDLIRRHGKPGEHYGSAVRHLEQLSTWFSESELARLQLWGYQIVAIEAERILAESPVQVVFATTRPLHESVSLLFVTQGPLGVGE